MQSAVQTTTTQQAWPIARCAQQRTRGFKVAAQEQHGYQARCDDFRITHPLLRILDMAEGVQNIGTQTINGYDLVIHGNLVLPREVGCLPSPWRKSPMDVNRSQLGLPYPPAAGWSLHPEVSKDGDAEEKSKRLLKSHGLHGAPPEILSTCLQRAIVRPNARDAPPPTCTRARRLVSWRRLRRPAPVWQASSWGHGRDGAIRHSEDRHVLNTRFGESHPPGHLCSVVLHRSCWLAKTVS
jgi:hypothetical protein